MGTSTKVTSLLLRLGLAAVLLYASIAAFVAPNDWVGFLPRVLTQHFDGYRLLQFFSAYELVLALWLLSGVYIRLAALAAAATFSGILLTNITLLPITFRDITMIFAALALAALPAQNKLKIPLKE